MFWPKQFLGTVSLWLLLSLLHTQNANAFIVPQELQSLLSIVYSNIPPIKKGTDSRFGFGFRLGEHADFQMLVELGPQRETRPLGDGKKEESYSKRQVSKSEQREHLRQQALMTSTERNAANWLENWSNGMKPQGNPKGKPRTKQTVQETPQMPMIAMQQLHQLYKMASTTETPPIEEESLKLARPSGLKLPPPELTQDTNSLGNSKPTKSSADITKELMNVSLEA